PCILLSRLSLSPPSLVPRGAPLAPRLDRDDDERACRRILPVLPVLRLQELERAGVVLDDPGPAGQARPPQARPVLVPVVDQDFHPRVGLDVREPLQASRRLRLLVDRRVER